GVEQRVEEDDADCLDRVLAKGGEEDKTGEDRGEDRDGGRCQFDESGGTDPGLEPQHAVRPRRSGCGIGRLPSVRRKAASHHPSYLLCAECLRRALRRQAAAGKDRKGIGNLDEFIEILRDDEDGGATAGKFTQGATDGSGGPRINTPGRLVDDEN